MSKPQQTLDRWIVSDGPSLFDVVLPSFEIPSFPSEILNAIFEYLPQRDLVSISACSRNSRAISRPLLFRDITIRSRDGLVKILCIAKTSELASLVRTLTLQLNSTQVPTLEVWSLGSTILATSLPLLSRLRLLDMDKCTHPVSLLQPLQEVIQWHPHLETLRFSNWRGIHNDLNPSFPPTPRRRPLVVEKVVLMPDEDTHQGIVPIETFITHLPTYLHHFQLHLHTLEIKTYTFDASIYRRLVGVTLPGVHTLTLSIYCTWESDWVGLDVYHSGSWIPEIVSGMPSLSRLELGVHIRHSQDRRPRLPWKALSRIPGLEGFGHDVISTCLEIARPGSLRLSLDPADAGGRRELNGLEIKGCYSSLHLSSEVLFVLDTVFAGLRSLEFDHSVILEGTPPSYQPHQVQRFVNVLDRIPSFRKLERLVLAGPGRSMADGRFCIRGLELYRGELLQEINHRCGESVFRTDFGATPDECIEALADLEVFASRCFATSHPPLPPSPIVAAFTSLAQRMSNLKILEWNVDDEGLCEEEEEEEHGRSFVWRVVRGEAGKARLVDGGSSYRRRYCCFSSREVNIATRGWVAEPIFDSLADFKPKFTLDNFLVRRV